MHTDLPPSSVVIATLNMHWGRNRAGEEFDIASALEVLDSDVVVLQEVWQANGSSDGLAEVETRLGYEVLRNPLSDLARLEGFAIVDDARLAEGTWGMAIASRHRLEHLADWSLRGSSKDPISRRAILVRVHFPECPLDIVAVHLSHRVPACITQLAEVLRLGRQQGAAIVLGDLNCPRSVVTCLARGYRSAGRGRTWPAHRPIFQLDHVLVSNRIRTGEATIIEDQWSDHRAVRAVLYLS